MEREWYKNFGGILKLIFPTLLTIITPICAISNDTKAMLYLSNYGYLNPQHSSLQVGQPMSQINMAEAIREFQNFVGIKVTGYLNDETMKMMSMPRCGVKDKISTAGNYRNKRYAFMGGQWETKHLTYKILKYTNQLSKSKIHQALERAFSMWSEVTPLKFRRVNSESAHINIRFAKYSHADHESFDGLGSTLAHAYAPKNGDVCFDDSEEWTVRTGFGQDLVQTAAHEFGHALGLSHSKLRKSVMYPQSIGYISDFSLHSDDIEGIQALYGANKNPMTTAEPPTPSTPTSNEDTELCDDGSIDTIFNSKEGFTYVFKGQHYWKLDKHGIEAEYPKKISKNWLGLPGNIDAAFTMENGKTYFFKGSKYWKYDGKKMNGNYPKDIAKGFPGIPNEVQGATVLNEDEKIYFFKGEKYWKYDPARQPPVKGTYPKPITDWNGIPNDLDDVFQDTKNYLYFFKKGKYYRFNRMTEEVDTADPPYPRNVGQYWFGCEA